MVDNDGGTVGILPVAMLYFCHNTEKATTSPTASPQKQKAARIYLLSMACVQVSR